MSSVDIHPLIRDTIHNHCDDERMETIIMNVLREVVAHQYLKTDDKVFKKRYREIILDGFKEDLGSA